MADFTIEKPVTNPTGNTTVVRMCAVSGITNIPGAFTYVSIYGNGAAGTTWTVAVGSEPVQTLPAGAVFSLPCTGRMYTQAIVVNGGGTVTCEVTVGY
jgi:hypothetical protein